jgi:hypothetical protein
MLVITDGTARNLTGFPKELRILSEKQAAE